MINWFFNNKEGLISDLEKTERILSKYSGGYSGKYLSAKEFHKDLIKGIERLRNGDESIINEMWAWFAPTCEWDDFVGSEGIIIGERIFQRLT